MCLVAASSSLGQARNRRWSRLRVKAFGWDSGLGIYRSVHTDEKDVNDGETSDFGAYGFLDLTDLHQRVCLKHQLTCPLSGHRHKSVPPTELRSAPFISKI